MPLIFLVLLGLFLFVKTIYDALTKNNHAFTADELDQMNRAVVGKSKKEVRQIQKRYSK